MDEKKVREAIEYLSGYIQSNINLMEKIEGIVWIGEEPCKTAIEALEKQISKKPICVPKLYSEELGFNDEIHCPSCRRYVGFFMEGMSEPEQMEYCCDCGQRIAKDWSE